MTTTKQQEALDAIKEHGTQQAAAYALGISRSSLRSRLAGIEHAAMSKEAEEDGFPSGNVEYYWRKTKTGSYFVKQEPETSKFEEAKENYLEFVKQHAPSPKITRKSEHLKEENLLVIDFADVHFGKMVSETETNQSYDLDIAKERMNDGMSKLLNRAKKHDVTRISFVMGNDILHTDNPHNTTTSGTRQDTSAMWYDTFRAAKTAYINCIEQALQVAPVHLIHNPSNHDYMSGTFLADSIASWFNNYDNVYKDQSSLSPAHRKYQIYGNSIIGFTHGDGAKEKDLPQIMQHEMREYWGKTKYAYWLTHHFHHKHIKNGEKQIEKDYVSINITNSGYNLNASNSIPVEVIRSPSPPDSWHDRNGYLNRQACEAFLFDVYDGQNTRFTNWF